MRRKIIPFILILVSILILFAHSYLAMMLDKKLMSKNIVVTLMFLLAAALFTLLYFIIKFYKRNPESLSYKIRDIPIDINKLPIEIQKMIRNKTFEDKIINKIEELFNNNYPRTTYLLIIYAYLLYNFGKKIMIDEKDEYCKKALKILEEAEKNKEELSVIANLKKRIKFLIQQ